MNVFCVFQRLMAMESLAAVCVDLGAAEAFVERQRREALEQGEPMAEWRVAEWPLLERPSHPD